ncbi:MAG: phosphate acetyltransferase [Candidatus Omnitrophica bacterium]|nr:phosphate acetyltransferase [Candidatus Omnitrophota bacterium]
MDTISHIRSKARSNLKHIVLPEFEDKRTLEAVRMIEQEGIAKVTVLTPDKVSADQRQRYINEFYETFKAKDMDLEKVTKLFTDDTLYCAAMMTKEGIFDGFVAGASHTTPDVARSAIKCLGIDERITIASSCFIMTVPDCPYGDHGTFIFADCGIIPEPNPRQLACIAVAASELASKVLGLIPRIAFLSYSTRGSARGKNVDKVLESLSVVREMAPDLLVDGEMQVDAAIVPEVAMIKYPDSPIGGKANILIFPDLESGNISYKLVERLAKARALGPLLMGLRKPCSDLSRGCSPEDIVDCVAVTAIRAQ